METIEPVNMTDNGCALETCSQFPEFGRRQIVHVSAGL
jgi:hypothetical protein